MCCFYGLGEKMSLKRYMYLLISIMSFISIFYRVDVRLSSYIIYKSNDFGIKSKIVQIGAKYLIKVKDPASYNTLRLVFSTCHASAHSVREDLTARLTAEILGNYKKQEAFDLMIQIVSSSVTSDGVICGVPEITYGISLLGYEYYPQIIDIARGYQDYDSYTRGIAITSIGIMKPSHPSAILDLSDLLDSTADAYIQARLLHALKCINTPDANLVVENFMLENKFEYQTEFYPCNVESLIES